MAKALVLTAVTGADVGQQHTLTGRVAKIGSASGNDLVLRDRTIAPRHAEAHLIFDRWFIIPSGNDGRGISINGLPVTVRTRLNEGDRLALGSVSYSVGFREIPEETYAPTGLSGTLPRLGDYLVKRGAMTNAQVAQTAQRQTELKRTGTQMLFGQLAYELGYISRSQLDNALAEQGAEFNRRFLD